MRWLALLSLSVAASALACSGSGDGSSSGSSGSSGVLPDGGTLPDGASPDGGACPAPPAVVLEAKARKLALAGDELVFLDRDAGPEFYPGASATEKTYAIRKVKTDGTSDTTLYTPATLHQIVDLRVLGGTIYFLESERQPNTTITTRIFSMPVAGGAPQLIAYHDDPELVGEHDALNSIAAVDAANVYVVRALQLDAIVWRVAIAGGAESLVYRGKVSSLPQLVGSDLFFRSSTLVVTGSSGLYGVGKVPAGATSAAPTPVGTAACKGDLVAGDFGLLCTGSQETGTERQLSKWALDGTGHTSIFTSTATRSLQIGPVVDGFVYTVPDGSNTSNDKLWKVPLTGGPATIIACDRAEIPRQGDFESGANTAMVAALDMVATPTELVWVENSKATGEAEKTRIYRAPR